MKWRTQAALARTSSLSMSSESIPVIVFDHKQGVNNDHEEARNTRVECPTG